MAAPFGHDHDLPKGGPADQLSGLGLADVELLLRYQQELLHTVSHHSLIVTEKSRRIGYTWAAAALAVLTSGAEKAAGGMDTLYLGPSLDMAREFIDTCAQWARLFGQAVDAMGEVELFDEDSDKAIKAFRISFASGYEIMALTSRPRSLRGRQGLVIIDEAAFHDDLGEVLKAALALLIWGGKVLVISTHDGDENPFNQLVEDIKARKRKGAVVRVTIEDALRDGLYRRVCLTTGKPWTAEGEQAWLDDILATYGDAAREELYCEPRSSGGAYLPRALIEARMSADIPVLRWSCKPEFVDQPDHVRQAAAKAWCEENLAPLLATLDRTRPGYYGQDFGRKGDLTVMWPLQLMQDLARRPPFVVELRNVPFLEQELIACFILDRLPRFTKGAVDAGGNGMQLAERLRQRYGAGRIEEVKLSQERYREMVPPYKAAMEGASVLLPKDADIRQDHQLVVMDGGVAKVPASARTTGADGGDRHGDSFVAAFLAYWATLSDIAPAVGETAPAQAVPLPDRAKARGGMLRRTGAGQPPDPWDELRELLDVVGAEIATDPDAAAWFDPALAFELAAGVAPERAAAVAAIVARVFRTQPQAAACFDTRIVSRLDEAISDGHRRYV